MSELIKPLAELIRPRLLLSQFFFYTCFIQAVLCYNSYSVMETRETNYIIMCLRVHGFEQNTIKNKQVKLHLHSKISLNLSYEL